MTSKHLRRLVGRTPFGLCAIATFAFTSLAMRFPAGHLDTDGGAVLACLPSYRLSAALLEISTCASLLPQLLVGPIAGAWIDRHDKRRLLLFTQTLLGIQALLLALLTYSGHIGANLIVIMSFALGVLNAVDTPLRQSLLSRFVDNVEPAECPGVECHSIHLFSFCRSAAGRVTDRYGR